MLRAVLTSPLFALLALGVTTGLLHLMFVWPRAQTAAFWKRADYVWLGFAVLGVVGATGQARQIFAEGELHTAEARARAAFDFLLQDLQSGPVAVCRQFMRSEWSPKNFDQLVASQARICDWYKRAATKLPDHLDQTFPDVNLPDMGDIRAEEDEIGMKILESTNGRLRDYKSRREQVLTLRQELGRTESELALIALSPLFLIFALALRITKVTGELRLTPKVRLDKDLG